MLFGSSASMGFGARGGGRGVKIGESAAVFVAVATRGVDKEHQ